MNENERIADEIDRMLHGGAWHGPAILESLAGVTAGQAAARPVPGAHSIWEIVLHMTAWAREVAQRLSDGCRPLVGEQDWPPVRSTEAAAWQEARAGLTEAHRRLRQAVREFPAIRLHENVGERPDAPAGADTFYAMLHGLAQHDAYHTGQIAILKRAIITAEPGMVETELAHSVS